MATTDFYICSKCFKRVESIYRDSVDNGCEHNWILDRKGLFEETPPPIIDSSIDLDEDVNFEIINNEEKSDNNYPVYSNSFNNPDIEQELTTLYDSIKRSVDTDLDINTLREAIDDITKFNKDTKKFYELVNSKVVEKADSIMVSVYALGLEKITANLINNLVKRSEYLENDEEGDNNLKFLHLSGRALKEYRDVMKELREYYVLPEVDHQLEKLKESNETVKTKPKLTPNEIDDILKTIREKTENQKQVNEG